MYKGIRKEPAKKELVQVIIDAVPFEYSTQFNATLNGLANKRQSDEYK